MDISSLKRDPEKVLACLKEMDDASVVCVKPVKVYIPTRFAERNLAYVGIDINIVGICAIVTEDGYYSAPMVNAMWHIAPSSTSKVFIDGDEYYEFGFEAGDLFLTTLDLVQTDTLVYYIFDEIISKAHVPWYIDYMSFGSIFETAKEHANASVGENREIIEMIISIIGRTSNNRHTQYRETVNTESDLQKVPAVFVPLRSVTYTAASTLNKLAGSRFKDGLTSSLVTTTDRVEPLEQIIRI